MEEAHCYFCGEAGFDLVGLKQHINYHCDVFDEVDDRRFLHESDRKEAPSPKPPNPPLSSL